MKFSLTILLFLFGLNASQANNWFNYGPGLDRDVYTLKVHNGSIFAGGDFTKSGSTSINRVAMWNGSQFLPLGNGFNNKVNALESFNGSLIAAGEFTFSGSIPLNRIASWNGITWLPLTLGLNNRVNALTIYNGDLIAAGEFTSAGGTSVNRIAKWDGISWQPLGSGLDDAVHTVTVHNGILYAGGDFSGRVARWSGAAWVSVSGLGGTVYALQSYNGNLFAGGKFSGAISQYNGNSWQQVGEGLNNAVYTLAVHNGTLVAGGAFDELDDSPNTKFNYIARWNGTQWSKIGSGMNNEVYAVTVMEGINIIAAGKFNKAGGLNAKKIAHSVRTSVVEGTVKYPGGLPVTRGSVKAHRFDYTNRKIIVSDSAAITLTGTYRLTSVPITLHHIIAFPDDELEDFIPTYYPSTIYWSQAVVVTPDTITTIVNITVIKKRVLPNLGKIKGKIKLNVTPLPFSDNSLIDSIDYLSGSIIYAMKNNEFYGYAISDENEEYTISSLPEGQYSLFVDRLTYNEEQGSVILNFNNGYEVDSVNFTLDTAQIVSIQNIGNEIPEDIMLHQNFPNPFNPVTNIRFDLPVNSNVILTVYNSLGKEVAVLLNSYQNAGSYNVSFNASSLSSGIYFYNLRVSPQGNTPKNNLNYNETKKMLLIK